MAGEQDILSLGLNIDSFNAQKMSVLKEYILSELEKYRMVGKFMDLPEINLSDTQLDYLILKIVEIIDLTAK